MEIHELKSLKLVRKSKSVDFSRNDDVTIWTWLLLMMSRGRGFGQMRLAGWFSRQGVPISSTNFSCYLVSELFLVSWVRGLP